MFFEFSIADFYFLFFSLFWEHLLLTWFLFSHTKQALWCLHQADYFNKFFFNEFHNCAIALRFIASSSFIIIINLEDAAKLLYSAFNTSLINYNLNSIWMNNVIIDFIFFDWFHVWYHSAINSDFNLFKNIWHIITNVMLNFKAWAVDLNIKKYIWMSLDFCVIFFNFFQCFFFAFLFLKHFNSQLKNFFYICNMLLTALNFCIKLYLKF